MYMTVLTGLRMWSLGGQINKKICPPGNQCGPQQITLVTYTVTHQSDAKQFGVECIAGCVMHMIIIKGKQIKKSGDMTAQFNKHNACSFDPKVIITGGNY